MIELIFILVIVLQLCLFCCLMSKFRSDFSDAEAGPGTYRLKHNQKLKAGEFLIDRSGSTKLVMQGDGNLVLYNLQNNTPIWSTNTYRHGNGCYVVMENNNLVVYNKYNNKIWATNTPKKFSSPSYYLAIKKNLLLIANLDKNLLWVSNSQFLKDEGLLLMNQRLNAGESIKNSNNSKLIMQHDGNLVLYNNNNTPIWSSQTYGHGTNCYAILQNDNNFVIYNRNNKPIWASNTSNKGYPGEAVLRLEENVLVMRSNTQIVWESK